MRKPPENTWADLFSEESRRNAVMYKELLFLYLIWGCNWSVMKVSNIFFSPISFATWRFGVGAAVLLCVFFALGKALPAKRYWPWIIFSGATQIAYNNVAIQLCISELGAGLAAVINYCMPLWMAMMAHFCLQERLSLRKIVGIATSIIGIAFIVEIDSSRSYGLTALFWGFSSSFVWAIGGIIIKVKLQGCEAVAVTTWQMVAGALVLIALNIFFPQASPNWNVSSVACVAYNGVLASAVAFFLWLHILRKMEAAKAGSVVLIVPIVGVLSGILFLGERFSLSALIGIMLVFVGLFIVQRAPSSKS